MAKRIIVDLSRQVLLAYEGDKLVYRFDCATGSRDNPTPTGSFRIRWKDQFHHSRQYNNAPMPYSMFFNQGIAIHEGAHVMRTSYLKFAGVDAGSHGCVRLSRHHAKILFDWTSSDTPVDVRL